MAPPVVTFVSDFFHPNVYEDGKVGLQLNHLLTFKVCISILHPPGHDETNPDERPEERWFVAYITFLTSQVAHPYTRFNLQLLPYVVERAKHFLPCQFRREYNVERQPLSIFEEGTRVCKEIPRR